MQRGAASRDPMEAPSTASVLGSSQRPQPPPKPELDDYVYLNFVDSRDSVDYGTGVLNCNQSCDIPAGATTAKSEDGDYTVGRIEIQDYDGEGDNTDEDYVQGIWRGSTNRKRIGRKNAGNSPGQVGSPGSRGYDTQQHETDDVDDEWQRYPRTLGCSVSVLDEKDAVARSGGARFAGEDPIHGRLRASDPFQWIGRLQAGEAAISGLIDRADTTLRGFGGGSTSGSSGAESAASGRAVSIDRLGKASRTETRGSSGVARAPVEKRSVTADAEGSIPEQEAGYAAERVGRAMMEYSEAVESRVIRGGVIIEDEDEEDEDEEQHDEDREDEEKEKGSVGNVGAYEFSQP